MFRIQKQSLLKLLVCAHLSLGVAFAAPPKDEFLDREVKMSTHSWAISLMIPARELSSGFKSPRNVKWMKIDKNTRILSFSSYDALKEKTTIIKMQIRGIESPKRKFAIIERIVIDGEEASPQDRAALAMLFTKSNDPLISKYSKWFDSLSILDKPALSPEKPVDTEIYDSEGADVHGSHTQGNSDSLSAGRKADWQ